jgi:serine/threonine-protein kinase
MRDRTIDEARQLAAANNFKIDVASEPFDENKAAGTVLDQNPSAAAELKEGRTIRVVVSKGPAPRPVPDLAGVDENTANQRLTAAGLTPKIDHQPSDTIAKGLVLGWQPQGTQPKGTTVTVVVSSGLPPAVLSDWRNHSYDEFSARITPLGIKVARKDGYSDTVPAGQIIATDPGPGAQVPRDGTATVTATVSKGFAPIPDVSGKSVADATNILNGAGYQVVGVEGPPDKAVKSTDPGAGTPAKKGTAVTLVTK